MRRVAFFPACSLGLLLSCAALAETPGESADALPGLVRVPLATPMPAGAVGAWAGYGIFEEMLDVSGPSHRAAGVVAGSMRLASIVALRFGVTGQANFHPGSPGGADASFSGEPELGARLVVPLSDALGLGGEVEARFLGAEAPSIAWEATTPTLRTFASYAPAPGTWLGLSVGYRFDNSAAAYFDPALLSSGDRITLGASSFDAVELGVGVSRLFGGTEVFAEYQLDWLVGSAAPSLGASPMSLGGGLRLGIGHAWLLGGLAEFSPSARPEPFPTDAFVPLRPRFSVSLGVTYRFGANDDEVAPSDDPAAEEPPPPRAAIVGRVVEESGVPIVDVQVTLGGTKTTFTDQSGAFRFDEVQGGRHVVRLSSTGFDPAEHEVVIEDGDDVAVEWTLYESLPAGQVRGLVLDVRGKPVEATASFSPGGKSVSVLSDGAFSVDLAPGVYTVVFEAPGYRTVTRRVEVLERGVVVMNVALEP